MYEALYQTIEQAIQQALPGAKVYIYDPMKDGAHLQALVIAEQFKGLSLVKQHQLVMRALSHLLATQVHALALKTFTPEKWENEKKAYGIA